MIRELAFDWGRLMMWTSVMGISAHSYWKDGRGGLVWDGPRGGVGLLVRLAHARGSLGGMAMVRGRRCERVSVECERGG